MGSDRPKVVHTVAGRPMIAWVVDAVRAAHAAPIVLVVGHGAEEVRAVLSGDDADLEFVTQAPQLGTGHAARCAEPVLGDFAGDVIVLAGDGPLVRPETIEALRKRHVETGAAATIATSVIDDPRGYGRVIRGPGGRFAAIVEDRDLAPEQRSIREIYPSYACFDAARLFAALRELRPSANGELYVTDVPAILARNGATVEIVSAVPPEDVLSINTPEQLAEVDQILSARRDTRRIRKADRQGAVLPRRGEAR